MVPFKGTVFKDKNNIMHNTVLTYHHILINLEHKGTRGEEKVLVAAIAINSVLLFIKEKWPSSVVCLRGAVLSLLY